MFAVTVRPPSVANCATATLTVAMVGPSTVTLLTVTPAPKSNVVPGSHVVNCPTTLMFFPVSPCNAEPGSTMLMVGVATITLNDAVSTSPLVLVVIVTVRVPVVAAGSIVIFASADVGETTWNVFT